MSLVVLSFYRDAEQAMALADLVAEHGGALGAAVCCAGTPAFNAGVHVVGGP